MTTLDINHALPVSARKPGLFARLLRALAPYRATRARQRVLFHLSQQDAHMLRDIGLAPRDVEDAFNRRSFSPLLYPIRPTRSPSL